MPNFHIKSLASVLACAAALTGCGGSSLGGSPGQASTAEGLFVGTNTATQTTTTFVVNTGAFYHFYSAANNPAVLAGALQGTTTQSGGSVTSADLVDINLQGLGVRTATLAGNYTTAQAHNLTITYPPSTQTITSASAYSATGYQPAPSLTTLAGTYNGNGGSSASPENQMLIISPAGAISGVSNSGCAYTGTATLLAKGNGYAITLNFGAAPCVLTNGVTTGIAYLDPATKRLYIGSLLAVRTDGFIFMGTKN
ncbi:hypothetical protein BH11PSE11_BH11PSE11_26910 [soil metagenome]